MTALTNQNSTPPKIEGINYGSGIAAALGFGLIGFFAPIAVMLTFTAFRWHLENASDLDRQADLHRLPEQLIFIVVGTAFVFAAAGFATYAVVGRYKFAWTLLKIFLITIACWFLLLALGILQPRYKAPHHPLIYPMEFLTLSVPPLLIGVVMALFRCASEYPNEGEVANQGSATITEE
jgi:hypothetical protein